MDTSAMDFTRACMDNKLDDVRAILTEWRNTISADTAKEAASLSKHPLQSGLVAAAKNGHASIVEYLLQNGFDVTPDVILAASSAESPDVFKAMIDSGWNINQSAGHTGDALSHAVAGDKPRMTKWLLEHGADPNENYRSETWTALDLGVIHASPETVKLLLDHGANISNTNSLITAAFYGRVDMINLLLDHGADINEIPDNDLTYDRDRQRGLGNALHVAARDGQEVAARILLDRGADKTILDSLQRSAMDLAKENGHTAIVDLLQC